MSRYSAYSSGGGGGGGGGGGCGGGKREVDINRVLYYFK